MERRRGFRPSDPQEVWLAFLPMYRMFQFPSGNRIPNLGRRNGANIFLSIRTQSGNHTVHNAKI